MSLDESSTSELRAPLAIYSGTDFAESICTRFKLQLIEPAWDLLAKMPFELRLRSVQLSTIGEFAVRENPCFVKPADPRRRVFDAGIYRSAGDIGLRKPLPRDFPILISDPVEFSAEYRLFISDGKIHAGSPYVVSGRPVWQPFGKGGEKAALNNSVVGFAHRLHTACSDKLPTVYVVDVGLIEGRGWAIVEFNPIWCSGILGANPDKVLDVLERAVVPLSD